jgi:RNA polymerase sigma-70 factor (ECF subfamily)
MREGQATNVSSVLRLVEPTAETTAAPGSTAGADATLELVRRAQAGDRAAFDQIYHLTIGRVYAVCLRMSEDRETAERLTQDAFIRAWKSLSSFRGDSAFTSWLHRLTVNVVLEDRRTDGRRNARVENVADISVFDRGTQPAMVGDRIDLERAVARLPKGARTVLVLFDIEGYSQEEIARLTGTAVGTVKAQLHRARRLLREMLSQ